MITNCMFFKAQDPDHAKEVHIGPITLTLQQLYISIVSTLIVFPPSLTIVTIFRKVRFIFLFNTFTVAQNTQSARQTTVL